MLQQKKKDFILTQPITTNKWMVTRKKNLPFGSFNFIVKMKFCNQTMMPVLQISKPSNLTANICVTSLLNWILFFFLRSRSQNNLLLFVQLKRMHTREFYMTRGNFSAIFLVLIAKWKFQKTIVHVEFDQCSNLLLLLLRYYWLSLGGFHR